MGRGPPYKRRTRRVGEEGPLVLEEEGASPPNWRSKQGDNAMGQGARMEELPQDESNEDQGYTANPRMVTWAKNVFGTEEDLRAGMERVGL